MNAPKVTGSITQDGITMSSNSLTDDQMRSTLQIEDPADTPDAPETPETPETADSVDAPEPVAQAKPVDQPTQKPDKKRQRYEELDRERHDLRRENERLKWEREREIGSIREEFQREMAELRRMSQGRPQETPKPQAQPQAQTGDDPEPDHTDTEKYPDGQFDRKYLKDQARWEARQEFQSIQQQARERFEQERQARQQFERQEAERQRIAKFGERLTQADPELMARFNDIPMDKYTRPMWDVVMESSIPHLLLAHMEDNPAKAQEIASLPPLHAFRALSRIEYELEAAANLTGSASLEKPKTAAHPPVNPVSGSHAAPRSGEPGPDASYEEHAAYWNKVEAEQRGRRR